LWRIRLRSFARLPAGERRLAVRAIAWLLLTRAGLRLLPFDRVHAMVAGSSRHRARDDWPRAVRRALLRATRALPGSTCLAQSMVAERLLHAGGHRATLTIGVARADASPGEPMALDAHAWVESGGVLVTGDDARDRYEVLATFASE
jgi:hypothetical protein